jgi:hypothetical protein
MESSSASIPPDALPAQPNVVNSNLPPRAQEDIDAEQEQLIEAIEDSHEEEEHIVPPEQADESEGDDDDTQPGAEAVQPGAEAVQPAAQAVQLAAEVDGQLPTGAAQVEEVRTYAQQKERAKEKVRQLLGRCRFINATKLLHGG